MTGRGKFILTLLIVAVFGVAVWRWRDVIAPPAQNQNPSINPADVKRQIDSAKAQPAPAGSPPSAPGTLPAGTLPAVQLGESEGWWRIERSALEAYASRKGIVLNWSKVEKTTA